VRGLSAALIMFAATVASGQRVQFPSTVPEGSPYTAPPVTPPPSYAPPPPAPGAAAPTWDPYAAGPPPAAVDPAAGAAAPGQPTTFIGNATRFFQQVDFDNTYLAGSNQGNNLGVTDTEVSATFAIPIFRNPFLVTPGFAAHFWNGPNSNGFNTAPALGPEMPPETYDAYLDTAWKPQITPRFSADLAVRVGMYTDFVYVTSRSLRTPGRALGLYALNPQWTLVAGAVYLDRLSVRLLPAGGAIWTPDADSRFELYFPRPKLMHRIATVRNSNLWGFIEGEYGGNTWTIHRSQLGGFGDVVDYNDLRLSIGTEWIGFNQRRANIEVGYVFNRRLEYRSGFTPTTYPHGTVMVRGGLTF
jgi:hypothetical protein